MKKAISVILAVTLMLAVMPFGILNLTANAATAVPVTPSENIKIGKNTYCVDSESISDAYSDFTGLTSGMTLGDSSNYTSTVGKVSFTGDWAMSVQYVNDMGYDKDPSGNSLMYKYTNTYYNSGSPTYNPGLYGIQVAHELSMNKSYMCAFPSAATFIPDSERLYIAPYSVCLSNSVTDATRHQVAIKLTYTADKAGEVVLFDESGKFDGAVNITPYWANEYVSGYVDIKIYQNDTLLWPYDNEKKLHINNQKINFPELGEISVAAGDKISIVFSGNPDLPETRVGVLCNPTVAYIHTHTYTQACGTVCNVCGAERVAYNHTYSSNSDLTCNVCGHTRTISTGTVGNCTWVLDDSVLTVSGSGILNAGNWGTNITKVVFTGNVSGVASNLFKDYTKLESVTFSDSFKTIGYASFQGCTSLKEINFSESITSILDFAFYGCTSLESVVLPNSVTEYKGECIFAACSSLKYVTFGNAVTTIGNHFLDGTAVEKIQIPASVKTIGSAFFKNCSTLKTVFFEGTEADVENMSISESINDIFFAAAWIYSSCNEHSYTSDCDTTCNNCNWIRNTDSDHTYADDTATKCSVCGDQRYHLRGVAGQCVWYVYNDTLTIDGFGEMGTTYYGAEIPWGTKVTKLVIGPNVTGIGQGSFYGCADMFESVTVDAQNTTYYSSSNCIIETATKKLVLGNKNITRIPTGVTSIGACAFYGCDTLRTIIMANTVTEIGTDAFADCTSLSGIVFSTGLKKIGNGAFTNCTSIVNVTLPTALETIGDNAFFNCSSLSKVTLPKNVKSIGSWAFYGCSSLGTVSLSSSLTKIGAYAFYECASLKSITIPDTVTEIGCFAFANCKVLTTADISDNVNQLEDGVFINCVKLSALTLPANSSTINENAFTNCEKITTLFTSRKCNCY